MNKNVSIYLDLMRILSALLVLIYHGLQPPFLSETVPLPGTDAVIIFFVISGFVISYVTDLRENDWQTYAIRRLSRIYSVAIPSLILASIVFWLVKLLDIQVVAEEYSYPAIRIGVSTMFLNQVWNLTISPMYNLPWWSLCFEVWYYVAFGFWCFAPKAYRAYIVCSIALLVGPRILLLAPIWLMGVVTYRLMRNRPIGENYLSHTILFWISLITLLVVVFVRNPALSISIWINSQLSEGYLAFYGSRLFIGDLQSFPMYYLTAILFSVSVYYSDSGAAILNGISPLARLIRTSSSYTFSIYLYHFPFLILFSALSLHLLGEPLDIISLLSLVIFSTVVLGRFTEHKRQWYKGFFNSLFSKLAWLPRT